MFGKAIGITAGVMARQIGADTWSSMLIGFVIGTLLMAVLIALCSRFPEKSLVQISEEVLGKWAGKAVGLALTAFFILAYGTSANVMTLHLSEYFLPHTPFIVLCSVYTLVCLYGVWLGIEVIIRFSLIGFIGLLLINLTMIIGTLGDFEFRSLEPILDYGLQENILSSVYVFSDLAMGIVTVGMLCPLLNSKRKIGKVSFWAMVLSAASIVIWPFFETGVIGADMMQKFVVCCMQQVRSAQFTKYLPRYELLMVFFFAFSVYVQSVSMFYFAKSSFRQVTGIKKEWFILIPLTALLIYITWRQASDHNKYIEFLTSPWPQLCAALCFVLTFGLFFTALFRGNRGHRKV